MKRSALLLLVACETTTPAVTDGGDEVTPEASPPFVEAMHQPLPTMPLNGGSVLTAANLVVVTYPSYPLVTDVESMLDWLPTSPWLTTVSAEYGVTAPSVLAKVRLTSPPPSFSSATAFTQYVTSTVGTSGIPAPPSKNTFYAFVLPANATFTDAQIGTICNSFTGYHDATTTYTFAVIGTCPGHIAGLTDAEQVERVLSHELIEALTDPFGDGYAFRDPESPWSYVGGGEVADVCNGYVRQQGFLAVQSWSNAAAAAGRNPCQPADPSVPYFDVSADSTTTQHVVAGTMVTLTLTGWSTAPTADWTTQVVLGAGSFTPTVKVGTNTFNNGTTTQLTIGVPSSATSGSTATILLHSLHPGDASYSLQPVVVRAE
jgi:hypothetical protein